MNQITTLFPEFSFENAVMVTKGWDNDVLIFDDTYVFRFPKREGYQNRFRVEIQLLAALEPNSPVSLPRYEYVAPDYSCGGYKIIQGTELQSVNFETCSSDARTKIARQLGEFLSYLHTTPRQVVEQSGLLDTTTTYWWSPERTQQELDKQHGLVFPLLEAAQAQWVEAQFQSYLGLTFDFASVLTHNDFVGDHIFFDGKEKITGVIDFADAEYADPSIDFAGLWDYGETFVHQVLEHYTGQVDDDFVLRSKFPKLITDAIHIRELVEGEKIPETIEGAKEKLERKITSGATLR